MQNESYVSLCHKADSKDEGNITFFFLLFFFFSSQGIVRRKNDT